MSTVGARSALFTSYVAFATDSKYYSRIYAMRFVRQLIGDN
jgi:hypothetical protein